jgi:hypothetical protein
MEANIGTRRNRQNQAELPMMDNLAPILGKTSRVSLGAQFGQRTVKRGILEPSLDSNWERNIISRSRVGPTKEPNIKQGCKDGARFAENARRTNRNLKMSRKYRTMLLTNESRIEVGAF